nr:MAG TPA: hypothetical protein [Caudoviricetes sp.]DAH66340.1 MAG TPA: hypothetical protein [Caudoviricetes sp.]
MDSVPGTGGRLNNCSAKCLSRWSEQCQVPFI